MIKVGISGWKYDGWKGVFYPKELHSSEELEFASHRFSTIEINSTFYRLQKPSTYQRWYDSTPEDFIFSVKANRYITHIKRLNDVQIPMANFFSSGVMRLKEKLGPILWQFPPSMEYNPERFDEFLALLPKNFSEAQKLSKHSDFFSKEKIKRTRNYCLRHAIEIRNISFLNPLFIEALKKYNVALVLADTAGKWPYMEDVTSDFLYLRLHGPKELYSSGYDLMTLDFWAERIKKWAKGKESKDRLTLLDEHPEKKQRDVYVYFDNDVKAKAPKNASELQQKLL